MSLADQSELLPCTDDKLLLGDEEMSDLAKSPFLVESPASANNPVQRLKAQVPRRKRTSSLYCSPHDCKQDLELNSREPKSASVIWKGSMLEADSVSSKAAKQAAGQDAAPVHVADFLSEKSGDHKTAAANFFKEIRKGSFQSDGGNSESDASRPCVVVSVLSR